MLGRILTIVLVSAVLVGSVTGKYFRYGQESYTATPTVQKNKTIDTLNKIMSNSHFYLRRSMLVSKRNGNKVGIFTYPGCNGYLYIMPTDADESEMINLFEKRNPGKVYYIYHSEVFKHYPTLTVIRGRIMNRINSVIGKRQPYKGLSAVYAVFEVGQCQLVKKIDWIRKE